MSGAGWRIPLTGIASIGATKPKLRFRVLEGRPPFGRLSFPALRARDRHRSASGGHFGRSTGREGGGDCLLKPLQPFFRDTGAFFRLCQLLPELFSHEMACLQLFLQNADLLISFETFGTDTLGEGECVRTDPVRLILDTRHRQSRAADHFEGLEVVGRLRLSIATIRH